MVITVRRPFDSKIRQEFHFIVLYNHASLCSWNRNRFSWTIELRIAFRIDKGKDSNRLSDFKLILNLSFSKELFVCCKKYIFKLFVHLHVKTNNAKMKYEKKIYLYKNP